MKRNHCILIVAFLLILSTIVLLKPYLPIPKASATFASDEAWSMFRHDNRHTGYSSSKAPDTNHTSWVSDLPYTSSVSSPAIADGKVFVGGYPVFCFNETTGELIWIGTRYGGSSSPCVANGKVFIGSYGDGNVYCLNASNGNKIWNHTIGSVEASPTEANGCVFIGSWRGLNWDLHPTSRFYCLNESTGDVIWEFETELGCLIGSSAAVANGRVFVGCEAEMGNHGNFYCFNESTGAILWNYTTGNVGSSPSVVDGNVFVGSGDRNVYCFEESTGAIVWNFTTGDYIFSSPAVADGIVFIGSLDRNVYALNMTNGNLMWNYMTGDGIGRSSPAVADGKVFIGSYDGNVYCLNELTGELIWKYRTFEPPEISIPTISSPAVANGKVFVGSSKGKLYTFFGISTSISISTSASSMYVGFKVNINGTLSDLEGTPLCGATIVLSYLVPGVPTWITITSVNTGSEGSYSAIWIPIATGNFIVKAEWAGNETYVETHDVKNLSVLPYATEYVFFVESNSTLSSLAFNSTANELSFTVDGPSGTAGYARLFISKALVANISDLKVYVDGYQTEFMTTSADNSWILHFAYSHSIHDIKIMIPEVPSFLVSLVFMIATLLAVIVYRRKKEKLKSTFAF